MKEYVVGFGFTGLGSVWLVCKNRPGVPAGWNGIGGKIDPTDKTAAGAMAREWKEETLKAWPESAREVCVLEGAGFRVHFFAAVLNRQEWPEGSENDAAEVIGTFSRSQLPADVVPNLRWLIPMAVEALDNPGRGAPYFVRETEGDVA